MCNPNVTTHSWLLLFTAALCRFSKVKDYLTFPSHSQLKSFKKCLCFGICDFWFACLSTNAHPIMISMYSLRGTCCPPVLAACFIKTCVPKAPSGLNRHKYVCLQASLQTHILCSVGAKPPFGTQIFIGGYVPLRDSCSENVPPKEYRETIWDAWTSCEARICHKSAETRHI